MGTHVIKLPDIGEGVTEAEIVEWNVAVGDMVREDDLLAAVMTDKATVEIPSPVSGKVLSLSGNIGDMAAVGEAIVSIETLGEGNVSREAQAQDPQPQETPARKRETLERETPAIAKPPAPPIVQPARTGMPRAEGEKPIASPAVRRRAMEAGIKLNYVHGTGPAGRISHQDLDAYVQGETRPRGAPRLTPNTTVRMNPNTRVDDIPVVGLRRKIAERMQDAMRRIPHITYVEEVDVTELESLRAHLNETRREEQPKLTVLPFIIRAMVISIGEHPKLNALYDDENDMLHQHGAVHVGVATQTSKGLMVPVVRHAEARDIHNTATEAKRLADVARDGSIRREELTGSTITLSSLGPMGGIVSTPVINSPEVAIVGVNKIVTRPVFHGEAVVPRKIMNLSSSFDHRIVDGWDAASFIQKIRGLLKHPATLFM